MFCQNTFSTRRESERHTEKEGERERERERESFQSFEFTEKPNVQQFFAETIFLD